MSLTLKKPFFHFSIDDVFDALIEVSDEDIELWEHPFWRLVKEIHEETGAQIAMYLFFQKNINGKIRTLQEVTEKYKPLFESLDWIQFGPHALDNDHAPYAQTPLEQQKVFADTYKEIDRFAGPRSHAKWVRLHFFSESYELSDYWKIQGVEALFATDKPAFSHRMPDDVKDRLREEGHAEYEGIHFIRTHFRMENFVNEKLSMSDIEKKLTDCLKQYGFVTILTHEYELERPEVRDMIKKVLRYLAEQKILSV